MIFSVLYGEDKSNATKSMIGGKSTILINPMDSSSIVKSKAEKSIITEVKSRVGTTISKATKRSKHSAVGDEEETMYGRAV